MDFEMDSKRNRWHLIFFAGLLCYESFLFMHMTSLHHAWIYPRWMDQIQYLSEGYMGYEEARQHGLAQGIWSTVVKPSPQGMLYAPLSVILFSAAGPSRNAALSLNLLAFLGLQIVSAIALRRISRSWNFVWIGSGLLLCVHTFVAITPGSAIDFRLDWMASCAFGITLSVALLSNGMRSRGWSAAFGLATSLTILLRFLTATYFTGIYLLMAVWLLLGLRHRNNRSDEPLHRLGNFTLASLIAIAVTLPVFWLNREWIYNYYWIGQITGTESAVRAPNFDAAASLRFIAEALAHYHLGALFLSVWAAIIAAPLLTLAVCRAHASSVNIRLLPFGPAFICTLMFFTVPFLILTLHRQKSEVVVSILTPATALLGLLLANHFSRPLTRQWRHRLTSALAAFAMICGLWHFSNELIRPSQGDAFIAGAQKVNALADYLYSASRAAGLISPRVAVDQVTDSLDAQIMRVICYERHGIWIPFSMTLPTGILESQDSAIMAQLAESDFVFLTDRMEGEGNWPYDRQMRRLYPALSSWSKEHLKKVEQFELFGRQMTLYQRSEIPQETRLNP